MKDKRKSLASRHLRRLLVWLFVIVLCLSYFVIHFAQWATREFYSDSYYNKMLITTEYTRRVLSDVYVAATNNIYYIEQNLGNPDYHKDVMARIVKNGTRVRSCGISFIEDYYPERGHHFCPFAWRNAAKPDVVTAENMGDSAADYLNTDWFRRIINADTTEWADPFFDSYDMKTPLTAYMAPIHDPTGRTVAVLGADVSLDWLTDKLNETDSTINKNASFVAGALNLNSVSYIVNHDGTFITHPKAERILKDNIFNHVEAYDDSHLETLKNDIRLGNISEQESREKFIIDGHECYVFYTPVKYTKWMIITVVPWQTIDMLGFINGLALLAIIALAMLIIVLAAYYYMKIEADRLKELAKTTHDMAHGQIESPMPTLKHHDEIGALNDALDKLQYALSSPTK